LIKRCKKGGFHKWKGGNGLCLKCGASAISLGYGFGRRKGIVTSKEAIAQFPITRAWLKKHVRSGSLKNLSAGRYWIFDLEQLEKLVEEEENPRKFDCLKYEWCLEKWAKKNRHCNDNPCCGCKEYKGDRI